MLWGYISRAYFRDYAVQSGKLSTNIGLIYKCCTRVVLKVHILPGNFGGAKMYF